MKYKIKEFYEKALIEGKFNSEFFKDLRKISTKVQLKNFIEENILPIAKEMGYDFSVEELLSYEIETVHKVNEHQLENISGGINAKNLALSGIISLMALGAGIVGTTNLTSAMNEEKPNEDSTKLVETMQSSFSSPETTKKSERAPTTIEILTEELTKLLKEIRSDFERSIEDLHPKTQLILTERFNEFYEDSDIFIRKNISATPAEVIKNQIVQKFNVFKIKIQANIQVNDIIHRVRETFDANIDILEDPRVYDNALRNFDSLIAEVLEVRLHEFNRKIFDTENPKDIQSVVEDFEKNIIKAFNRTTGFSLERIKGAQRRFMERKSNGVKSFVTSSTKPKFAGPLNVTESIKGAPVKHINRSSGIYAGQAQNVSWHDICTPFGKVILKVLYRDDKTTVLARLIVNAVNSDYAMSYKKIFSDLDNACRANPERIKSVAEEILRYLSTELTLEDVKYADLLSRFNSKFESKVPSDTVNMAAATLCGTLMFCESCELRNPTGGKLERAFIRRVIRNIKNRVPNPFQTAARGHYPPHLNASESSGMGGVATTRDVLSSDGPQTSEGKNRAAGVSEFGSDVSSDSDKNDDGEPPAKKAR